MDICITNIFSLFTIADVAGILTQRMKKSFSDEKLADNLTSLPHSAKVLDSNTKILNKNSQNNSFYQFLTNQGVIWEDERR